MSNRAIAEQFDISYQTADRLVRELSAEGLLVRRSASGTYLPGQRKALAGAILMFNTRARRAGSFGARLLGELTNRLDRERIGWQLKWIVPDAPVSARQLPADYFPVLWEVPAARVACAELVRPALLLNERPPSSLASVYVDSVSTDDRFGGACAAELLCKRTGRTDGFTIVAGPRGDTRSDERVAGFQSVAGARVLHSASWYFEEGVDAATKALARRSAGIFCCNDRLAEAVVSAAERMSITRPAIVGFDDAPVADALRLTTIAIPWSELTTAAVSIVRQRLVGAGEAASHRSFIPRPVVRWR